MHILTDVEELVMVSAAEARRRIIDALTPLSVVPCPLSECGGRVLASDVQAPHDVPLFDNSGMDGFAVRSADLKTAATDNPTILNVIAEIPAGKPATSGLEPGTAMRIMTGAPVPSGADAVVEQELAQAQNGTVRIPTGVVRGRNIRRRGEDIRSGTTVLQKGTRLGPGAVGVLASLGITSVETYRRPSVAVITTGDELIDVSEQPKPGQIRNSNAWTLAELLRRSHAEPVILERVQDSRGELSAAIRKGLLHDAVITTGGISVGTYDMVLEILKAEGVEIDFWKINVKPGMPVAFGLKRTGSRPPVPVFALPGNPVSAMVTFLQFVRPGMERLSGVEAPASPLRIHAFLGEEIRKKDGKRHFVRGIAANEGDRIVVRPTGSQSSGVLTSMVAANCLILIPEEMKNPTAGDPVEIELL